MLIAVLLELTRHGAPIWHVGILRLKQKVSLPLQQSLLLCSRLYCTALQRQHQSLENQKSKLNIDVHQAEVPLYYDESLALKWSPPIYISASTGAVTHDDLKETSMFSPSYFYGHMTAVFEVHHSVRRYSKSVCCCCWCGTAVPGTLFVSIIGAKFGPPLLGYTAEKTLEPTSEYTLPHTLCYNGSTTHLLCPPCTLCGSVLPPLFLSLAVGFLQWSAM